MQHHWKDLTSVKANDLQEALWLQIECMRNVLFRITVAHWAYAGNSTEWMPLATSDLEEAFKDAGAADLSVSVHLNATAAEWGIESASTLSALVEAAPEGSEWKAILEELGTQLANLNQRVKDTNREFEAVARRGLIALQELQATAGGESVSYSPTGELNQPVTAGRLLNQSV